MEKYAVANRQLNVLETESYGVDDTTCALCNTKEWLGKPLTMHLDYVDGDSRNDNLKKLKVYMPQLSFTNRNILRKEY